MNDLPWPWKFGISDYHTSTKKYEITEMPFNYEPGRHYNNPSIYAANGEEVVGCDEYYVFHSEQAVRLLTAAPELLDALQKMCEVMDEGYGDIAKQLVRDMAQAAINKATGETQ